MSVGRYQKHWRSHQHASTLAEVLVGMAVLTLIVLAVLGILIQSSYLERTDTEQTEVLALAQGLLETRVDEARTLEAFQALESTPLAPCNDPNYLFEQVIADMPMGMKRVTISIFYADDADPSVPDTSRVKGGHALTLSVAIAEPTT